MSTHINAQKGDIAEIVLLPGDPLRAKFIAENFLEEAKQYNTVRNAFGYTGSYKGVPISVQGTGMGMPSAMIYSEELVQDYGAKILLRVGSAGAINATLKIRDLVLGQGATTDAALHRNIFHHQVEFAPIANFDLLKAAHNISLEKDLPVHVGNVLSSDRFYNDELDKEKLAQYGVLAVEMEAAGIYSVAAKHGVRALAIMTVSDSLVTGEETTAEEREKTFGDMIEVALEAALQVTK